MSNVKIIKQGPFDKKIILNKAEAENLFRTEKPEVKKKRNAYLKKINEETKYTKKKMEK